MKFLKRLEKNALIYKDKIAYKVLDEEISFEDLWKKASFYGEILRENGNGPVIVYGNKNINILITIISCLLAKRSYVPIDFCTPLARIKQIIKDCNCSLVITDENLEIEDVCVKKLSELSFDGTVTSYSSNNDIAYIIFTSGSTGKAKGVPISYDNLDNFIDWISNINILKNHNNWKVLNQASFSFDLSVADLYYSLNNGCSLVSLTKAEQDSYNGIFKLIKDNEINFIVATPTFIRMCLLNNDFNSSSYPNIECIYFCGESLDKNLVGKIFSLFPKVKIINAYGPTEATSAVSYIEVIPSMLDTEEYLPVGRMDTLATEVTLENGEIILKGASVSCGYVNATGGFYKENGINCFKTGDLGKIENNKLYCLGRKDNQIKFMGYRIELEDVENNIKSIDGVIDCAVITQLDCSNKIKKLRAFVVLDKIDLISLKKQLSKKMPDYMIPKSFVTLDKMPVNKNGKIDRKELIGL